jgi:hypothetical protein
MKAVIAAEEALLPPRREVTENKKTIQMIRRGLRHISADAAPNRAKPRPGDNFSRRRHFPLAAGGVCFYLTPHPRTRV